MNSALSRSASLAITLIAMLPPSVGHAAATVIDYHRIDEAEPSATNGGTVNATTADSAGTKPLTRVGWPRVECGFQNSPRV